MRNVNPLGAFAGPAVGLASDQFESGVALPLQLANGGNLLYADVDRAKDLMPCHAYQVSNRR